MIAFVLQQDVVLSDLLDVILSLPYLFSSVRSSFASVDSSFALFSVADYEDDSLIGAPCLPCPIGMALYRCVLHAHSCVQARSAQQQESRSAR